MDIDLEAYVSAFAGTWGELIATCCDLTAEQWETPTALPGWSVKDNVSHIVAEESALLGDPAPPHQITADLPYLRSDRARALEVPIDYRRPLPGAAVLRELEDVTERRLEALRAYDEATLDEEVAFAGRTMPLRNALAIRLLDNWIHGQDIRRALNRPGDLDTVAARLTLQRLLRALSGLADGVPAAAGRTVVVETTGPIASVTTLRLGTDPSCVAGDAVEADVRISCPVETFVELATGRASYDDRRTTVAVTGDEDLGTALLQKFAVTP